MTIFSQIGAPKEDQDRVRTKIPVGGKKRRKKSSGEFKWTEGDPTCPAGWKIRIVHCADCHSVTFFLTPEGTTIKGRFSNQLSQRPVILMAIINLAKT